MILLVIKLQNATVYHPSVLLNSQSSVFKRYSEVYRPLRVKAGFLALNYYSWFLYRRVFIVAILLLLNASPLTQLLLHILLGLIEVFLLLCHWPFVDRVDQMFSVINAFFVLSIYCFLLYTCLSNNDSEEVDSQGWIMIVVVIVFNGVSFLAIFIFKAF